MCIRRFNTFFDMKTSTQTTSARRCPVPTWTWRACLRTKIVSKGPVTLGLRLLLDFRCWSSKAHSVFTRTPFGQQSFVIAQHWWTKSTTTPLLTTSHKRYGCTITKDYLVSLGIDLPSAKDVITFYASAWINVRVSSLQRIFSCSTVNSFFRELCIMFLTINISHLALYHTGGSFSWRSLYI